MRDRDFFGLFFFRASSASFLASASSAPAMDIRRGARTWNFSTTSLCFLFFAPVVGVPGRLVSSPPPPPPRKEFVFFSAFLSNPVSAILLSQLEQRTPTA